MVLLVLFLAAPGPAAFAKAPATAPPPGERATVATSNAALRSEVNALVAELLGSNSGAKGVTQASTLQFDGVSWKAENGAGAGTSPLGLRLDDAVRRAMSRQRVSLTGALPPGSKGAGGRFLRGAFQVLKTGVRMSLSVVDAQTGRVLSEAQRLLSPSALAGLAAEQIAPPDAANALQLAQLVEHSFGGTASGFGLRVSTDRGLNAAYFEGERLRVSVAADRDCHLRLYHVSWRDRTLTLVFPNRSEPDGFLAAGAVRVIPGEGSRAVFVVSPPYGVDAIVAVASEAPFPDDAFVASALASGGEVPQATGPAPPTGDGGVESAGEYLAARGIDSTRVHHALAKGLLVRHLDPDPVPTTTGAGDDPVTTEPDPAPEAAGASAPEESTPPPAEGRHNRMARAACFFTTLPTARLRR